MTQFNPKTLAKKLAYIVTLGSFLGSIPTQAMTFNISIENETDKGLGFHDQKIKYSTIEFNQAFYDNECIIPPKNHLKCPVDISTGAFKNRGYLDNPNLEKDGIWFELVEPGTESDLGSPEGPKVGIIFDNDAEPGVPIFFPFAQEVPEGYKVDIHHAYGKPLYHIVISKK